MSITDTRKNGLGTPFSEAREGATLQIPPPFSFNGVTARVFPLRANMSRLHAFIDRFLNNGVPPELVYFRPAMPMVFVQAIHYGKMAVDTQNFGWFSQHELVFSVPVERYRMVDNQPVFEGFGLANPFIFVDKDSSEIIGREVYGWPKVHGWIDKGGNESVGWTQDPRSATNRETFNTLVYGETFAGRGQEPRPIIEISEKAALSFSEFPVNLTGPLNPLLTGAHAIVNFSQALQQMWANVANLSTSTATAWIDNVPAKGIRPLWNGYQDLRKIQSLIPKFLPITAQRDYSLITLKQFRDAQDPRFACYQAVIDSNMYLNQLNAGGLLGDQRIATGDLSGGFALRIHEYPSQPIASSLGLEPVNHSQDVHGAPMATFEPILPFWLDVDISYKTGNIICSQTLWSDWESGNDPANTPTAAAKVDYWRKYSIANRLSVEDLQDTHLYNSSRGEAMSEVTGPYRFPNATVRVLPLKARKNILQNYVTDAMDCAGQRFEVIGDMVYMTITDFDEMSSETNNIGRWINREVRFAVPVRWLDCRGKEPREISMALLSPFVFYDRDTAMTTMREIYGETAFAAGIVSPRGSWLDSGGPDCGADLLDVYTDVVPALFTGSQMQRRKLLSVSSRKILGAHDHAGWDHIAATWGQELVRDLASKRAREKNAPEALQCGKALALALLTGNESFNQVTLKQFRDAHDVQRACYQALVNTKTTIERVWDMRPIEEPLHVSIFNYPTQPIVKMLGLVTKQHSPAGVPEYAVLEPLHPFWFRASIATGDAQNVAVRAGSATWWMNNDWFASRYFNSQAPCPVGPKLADHLDAKSSAARRPAHRHGPVASSSQPTTALDALDPGPQLAASRARQSATAEELHWQRFHDAESAGKYLNATVAEWQSEAKKKHLLSRPEVSELFANDDLVDPQMILESMLSHEWAHWGRSRLYRRLYLGEDIMQLPNFCVRRDSVGTAAVTMFPAAESMEVGTGGWYPATVVEEHDAES